MSNRWRILPYFLPTLALLAILASCAGSGGSSDPAPQVDSVATPTFSPPGGTYNTDQSVVLASATPGATIYYTADGTAPTTSSPVFSTPLLVAGNGISMTINAVAVKAGMSDSTVASATYTINNPATVATPTFSPPGGTYNTDQSVVLASATPGATIYYTADGTAPTTSSPVFSTPIPVAGNGTVMTINAVAVKAGMSDSTVASATYTINNPATVATPTFSPPGGTYNTDQSVVLASATPGATIYYTSDGTAPTMSSPVFSTPIPVAGNGTVMTINAVAVKAGMSDSTVASATYTISQSTVVFTQPPRPSGGFINSSWVNPDGSDSDMYAYDNFTAASDTTITEVRWRGGYVLGAPYGRVTNFSLTFFDSIAGGTQPLITNPQLPETYLAKYLVGGNAGETLVGTAGGSNVYEYRFVLPTPVQARAGTTYWLRIEGYQPAYPDWGISVGTGGDGQYYRFSTGLAMFQLVPGGDAAFTLLH